jgi:DNA-directed RNA polymerase subunit RPC12/RpoP
LEDAIRERQQQVEAAVNSGFSVDKQTLARAALADDEVRKLLPLRLILPSIHDLSEMVGVLQVHKENALRNSNLKKAMRLQGEIDDLESQLDLEKKYVLKRKLDMAAASSKCISCGEPFTPETKMVGILKTKEYKCPNCRGQGLIASLIGGSPKAAHTMVEKKEESAENKPEEEKKEETTTEAVSSTEETSTSP